MNMLKLEDWKANLFITGSVNTNHPLPMDPGDCKSRVSALAPLPTPTPGHSSNNDHKSSSFRCQIF